MKIFDLGNEGKGFSIGFDNNIELGNQKKLNKYLNINYEGLKEANDDQGKKYTFYKVHFNEGDEAFKEYLLEILRNSLDQKNFRTFVDIVEYLSNIFKNYVKSKIVSKLVGDIGEIIFILHLEKNNISWEKNYHINSNALFDFSFNNYSIDIKTTTRNKKTIKLSLQQLKFDKPKKIVVVNINKVESKLNIIQLINKIKNHHDVIDEMRKFWSSVKDENSKFINSYTADENSDIFILDDDKIPIIDIKHEGNLKNAIFEINTTNNSKKYLDKNDLKLITK